MNTGWTIIKIIFDLTPLYLQNSYKNKVQKVENMYKYKNEQNNEYYGTIEQ